MARHNIPNSSHKTLRALRKKEHLFTALSITLIGALAIYGVLHSRTMISPTAYAPLLNVIAKGESHGNYNAYFGNVSNSEIIFTDMTLGEVLEWQAEYVSRGNPSNAVGRYQFIQPTLEKLINKLNLNLDVKFSAQLQDRLAIALIEERGAVAFVNHKLSIKDFLHNLAKEWAALPRIYGDTPEASYYEGDGLNHSRVDSKAILKAAEEFKYNARK